jgi:single-stranded DNA-binding protein|tara:strand:- start:469 stop:837 length:369 start_codon:yes stop_codon:yes gene_type:complete
MNYSIFIVKIIQNPEQSFFEDDTSVTEVLVQFPQFLNKNYLDIFQISVWGNLAHDVAQYYKINDYLIIEGSLSLRENHSTNFGTKKDKEIEFTVSKLYPFLLKNKKSTDISNLNLKQTDLPF